MALHRIVKAEYAQALSISDEVDCEFVDTVSRIAQTLVYGRDGVTAGVP